LNLPQNSFLKSFDQKLNSPFIMNPSRFGSTFIPTNIASLVAWYDASDSSTRTIATGVSNLADKSGNGNDLAQPTGSMQPTVLSAFKNGLDMLDFNSGATQDLFRTTWTQGSLSQPMTIVFVGGWDVTTTSMYMYDTGSGGRNYLAGGTVYNLGGGSAIAIGTMVVGDHLYYAEHNTTSSSLERAGAVEGTGNVGTNAWNGLVIGNYQARNPSNDLNGQVGEFFVFNEVLSAEDKSAVTTYLGDKWAVTV
jgi:hypothetical protein